MVESRAANPLLDRSVVWSPIVRRCLSISLIVSGLMYTMLFLLPQYLQLARNLSPTASALHLLPVLITQIIVTPLVGRWISRDGRWRHFAVTALVSLTVGMLLLGTLRSGPETIILSFSMVLVGIGLAGSLQVLMALAQTAAPVGHAGAVTSLVTFSRSLGSSIGIAALGSLSSVRAHSVMPERLEAAGLSAADARQLAGAVDSPAAVANLPDKVREAVAS
ncbi:MFS transporter [Aeromicrobium sp. UC242_57]|uniref:MFS transporter n=1 Tax=Aeromicrobium sp. UC242_57 TaxID=3374624 RepID=UPI0037B1A7BC